MRFTYKQVAAFERLSHDHNPLHTDPVYSRSTQFGRPVVYGMCSLVVGMASWAKGRSFRLARLEGQFGKPLFVGDDYDLRIAESGSQVKIHYLKGFAVQSSFVFAWEPWERSNGTWLLNQLLFQPRLTASDPQIQVGLECWQNRNFPYSINEEDVSELLPELGLELGQVPPEHVHALLGSSYFVGMEFPGRQALYSSFEFEFGCSSPEVERNGFQFDAVSVTQDERLSRVTISGRGSGIRSFCLVAFRRPPPVRYRIEDIRAAVGQSKWLENKTVFISGATRGFGSVLAKTLALQGAKLMLNYRSNRQEAEAMAAELQPWNTSLTLLGGDVSDRDDCRNIRAEINNALGKIDILISNAFPQIAAGGFLEQGSHEFLKFVQDSLGATVTLFHELIPLISKGGMVVLVSTIYTQAPKPQFCHYVAAKSALEGLMRALANEFRQQHFLIVRPPRMLTDQTNLPFDPSPPASPIEVGRRFLKALEAVPGPGNLFEINLA